MGKRTGLIRYNLRERGRKHRGQPRNFDTARAADIINSAEVQERVRNRDMTGYYGHWPRVMFGMQPVEGGVVQGKVVSLEHALVTTTLRADKDGNIEHEAEFLDTGMGKIAERLFESKAGGFSSAIDTRKVNGVDIPIMFHGFDYVIEPNFTTNRGYALDGVRDEEGEALDLYAVLDAAASETGLAFRALSAAFDGIQGSLDRALAVIAKQAEENEWLMGRLAKAGVDPALDSASFGARGVLLGNDDAGLRAQAAAFDNATLVGYEPLEKPAKSPERRAADARTNEVLSRLHGVSV
jgi:hypothetical protein